MKQETILKLFKPALPLVLGAVGGFVAATYPAMHIAFCSGSLL